MKALLRSTLSLLLCSIATTSSALDLKEAMNLAQQYDTDFQAAYANYLATTAAKEQNSSPGLINSGFASWLEKQREDRGQYLDFFEDLPPGEDGFSPPGS